MRIGFRRHIATKKTEKKKKVTQKVLGHPKAIAFSVGQDYSLVGCSPAEPTSAYPDKAKVRNTPIIKQKCFQQFLGSRG